ncbi:MAG: SIMPL domain-containing protein [Candidatus Latescibacteria bacterium]|nr:SIMPL domain-containing protein [Candidatus Latescibacterota bacterium]
MEKNTFWVSSTGGLAIGLGIVIAGICLSIALYKARAEDRYVTVRGLAEREVDADLAIWPITFKDAGNDLVALQKVIETKREVITRFLVESGFNPTEISHAAPRINDTQAEREFSGRGELRFRYLAQTTVTLRSGNIALLKQTMEKSGSLVGKGIALGSENWENRTVFLFTGLNAIKPAMIEEATVNAREAAEKFAKDSRSKAGQIRNASQGLFTIEDRDMNSPDRKKVRVVTSVQYYLVDE